MAMYVPDEINLTLYRILTGDQHEFITKFTNTQTALETFSDQLNPMVASIAQALADALEVAENTRQQAISDTTAIKNQTALIRDATYQIKADTAQIQTATQSIYANEVIPARDATLGYRNEAATIRDQTQALSESGLPPQTGNAGKSLMTDGEGTVWGSPLPALAGNARRKLSVNTSEDGVVWLADPEAFITGDILDSAAEKNAPDWLECNGSVYLQDSYPELFALIGLSQQPFDPPAETGSVSGGSATSNWYPRSATFTPDDSVLFVHGSVSLLVFNVEGDVYTLQAELTEVADGVMVVSRSGQYLMVMRSSYNTVYSPAIYKWSGSLLTQINTPSQTTGNLKGRAISSDGEFAAYAYQADGYWYFRLLKNTNDSYTQTFQDTGYDRSFLMFTPDGSRLLSVSSSGQMTAYDVSVAGTISVSSQFDVSNFNSNSSSLGSTAISSDGSTLVNVTGSDSKVYTVGNENISFLGSFAERNDVPFISPAGRYIVLRNSRKVYKVTTEGVEELSELPGINSAATYNLEALAFTNDEERAFSVFRYNNNKEFVNYSSYPYDQTSEFVVPTLPAAGTFANVKRYIKS